MCGRYANARHDNDFVDEFEIDEVVGPPLPPSWNVAPSQPVRIVIASSADRSLSAASAERIADAGPRLLLRAATWGLIPSWAKDPAIASRLINARSETLCDKPAFRAAALRRRCLVPADGYYEWQGPAGAKQAFYLHPADLSGLAMAGLYEVWADPAKAEDDPHRVRWTCTVVTRPAPDALGAIHDRSPVVVPRDLVADWLDPRSATPGAVESLLAEIPAPRLVPRAVGSAVGNVKNDGPDLVLPLASQGVLPLEM